MSKVRSLKPVPADVERAVEEYRTFAEDQTGIRPAFQAALFALVRRGFKVWKRGKSL